MIAVCRRVSIPNCEQVIQFVVITREIVALFDLMCWNFFHPLSLDNDKRINDIQSNWLFNMSRGGSSMDESHNGGNLKTIEQRFVTQHSLDCPTFFFFSVWPIESENGHGSKQSTPTARYRKKLNSLTSRRCSVFVWCPLSAESNYHDITRKTVKIMDPHREH